jgi:pimeloyl-ACP methyl ester carboxylesterase
MKKRLLLISAVSACMITINAQKSFPYPPLGKLVDIGGRYLHIHQTGKGSPTVILENGSGDFSFIWSLVQPEVSKFTHVVSYDRAGYAWSDPGPSPRTDKQITLELHTALHKSGINPPYILVGQSYGGFLVRAFARYYPKEVAGMVLVEAVQENMRILIGGQPTRIREFATGRFAPEPQKYFDSKKYNYVDTATLDTSLEFPLDRLPLNIQKLQRWAQSRSLYRQASDSEMYWSPEDVAKLYSNKGKPEYMLGNKPLIVLTRGKGGFDGRTDSAELEQERFSLQNELSRLSTNSLNVIDNNSGHNIHLEDPEFVISAIHQVVEAVRLNRPLKEIKKEKDKVYMHVINSFLNASTVQSRSKYMSEGFRSFFADKKGAGKDKATALRSFMDWDGPLHPDIKITNYRIDGNDCMVFFNEKNDFTKHIGYPGWKGSAEFIMDDQMKIKEYTYFPDGSNPPYKPYLQPALEWLKINKPEELNEVYQNEKLIQTNRSAHQWITLLSIWKKQYKYHPTTN